MEKKLWFACNFLGLSNRNKSRWRYLDAQVCLISNMAGEPSSNRLQHPPIMFCRTRRAFRFPIISLLQPVCALVYTHIHSHRWLISESKKVPALVVGHIDQNRCVQRWPGQNSWVSTNWNRQHHLRSLHRQVFSFKLTSGWTAKSRMTLRPDDSSLLHLGRVVPAKSPNDCGDVRCSISCHRGKMFHQGLWIGLQGRILINEYGEPGLGYIFPSFLEVSQQ